MPLHPHGKKCAGSQRPLPFSCKPCVPGRLIEAGSCKCSLERFLRDSSAPPPARHRVPLRRMTDAEALGHTSGIAVDNSTGASAHDAYVADISVNRLEKFCPSSEFILMFGEGPLSPSIDLPAPLPATSTLLTSWEKKATSAPPNGVAASQSAPTGTSSCSRGANLRRRSPSTTCQHLVVALNPEGQSDGEVTSSPPRTPYRFPSPRKKKNPKNLVLLPRGRFIARSTPASTLFTAS